jgi:hypothetical protein
MVLRRFPEMDETAEQLRIIWELLDWIDENTGHMSGHTNSLLLWLDREYLPGAQRNWRTASRLIQADQYIEWLREEIYGES